MSFFAIIVVALGLAADAFAVAVGVGFVLKQVAARQAFRLSFHFGFFQFIMPIVGWGLGTTIQRQIAGWDHWIAFALLAGIGGKMIYDSRGQREELRAADPTRGASLVVLSAATSIDAFGVGLSLAMLHTSIWLPSVIIGFVAAGMTVLGLHLGVRFGQLLGKRVEIGGGVVLIGIGVWILFKHIM